MTTKNILLIYFTLFGASLLFSQERRIQVLSATIKDKRIENAEVVLQKNGEQSVKAYTDANGNVVLYAPFKDDYESTIIIKKEGYSTLVAKGPSDGLTYAISTKMKNIDGMRVVLSWGANPEDLDAHLVFPNNHVFFGEKVGEKANLDVDDTDSYGPETITIDEVLAGNEYIYSIHDYTNKNSSSSKSLSNSQAKIFVYAGESLIRTYYVPKGITANLWEVFKINKYGEMQDVNTMSNTVFEENDSWEDVLNSRNSINNSTNYDSNSAKKSNRIATEYYNSKDYETAIYYYNEAINADPNYGQAYGNLSLCYFHLGRNPEALWANRKAIELAEPEQKTLKAGANYNIGKIYESQGDYRKALEYYQKAKQFKNNPVYDKAIERVKK